MKLVFFPSCFLLIVFVFDLPKCLCDDDPSYTNCSHSFDCGDMVGINYPFWGNGRADYCGRSGFELKCQEDSTPLIQITTETYRVFVINQTNQIMTIARIDLLDDVCPSDFVNATLNFTLFDYTLDDAHITLSYGCPPDPSPFSNPNICEINGTRSSVYIDPAGSPAISGLKNLGNACNVSVIFPVLRSAARSLNGGDLSNLSLVFREGFDVKYVGGNVARCKQCTDSGGRCGRDYTSNELTCFCRDGPHQTICPNSDSNAGDRGAGGSNVRVKIAIGTGIAGTFIIVLVIIFCLFRRKYSSYNPLVFWKKKTKNDQNIEAFLKNQGLLALKRYTYSDIKKMTNSFKEKLGQGGYGGVFKGKLLDGRAVAVKVLSETKGNGEEFINEVASISRTSHVNIVTLFGFCIEGSKRALVYEFMPNGSLEKFIYDEKSVHAHPHLGWETIYKIAIGIAHGLEYLHRGCKTRILHFDIKPHNILLDEEFCPKISDFGLAKLCFVKESIISMIGARGTPGYIAPELFSRNFGGVSHKSDVYSYGMMVLEMVGRRKNIDAGVSNTSEIYFPHWIYNHLNLCGDLGLHDIATVEEKEITWKMIVIGLWCIQIDPLNRPSMSRVLEMLGGNLEALQIPPKPFLSSPPREQEEGSSTRCSHFYMEL